MHAEGGILCLAGLGNAAEQAHHGTFSLQRMLRRTSGAAKANVPPTGSSRIVLWIIFDRPRSPILAIEWSSLSRMFRHVRSPCRHCTPKATQSGGFNGQVYIDSVQIGLQYSGTQRQHMHWLVMQTSKEARSRKMLLET